MFRSMAQFVAAVHAVPLLLALSFGQASPTTSCANAPVVVVAASPLELNTACGAAEAAIRRLGKCGLAIRRPLTILIEPTLRHPFGGPVFALFEGDRGLIRLTRYSEMPALVARTPFSGLPLSHIYRSVIVHEVVHGILHQSVAGRAVDVVASEYLAHALQVASLPSAVRDAFLGTMPLAERTDDLVFSDIMLSLNPYLFAARAYQHLAAADECTQIHALLKGAAQFILSSRDLM